MPLAVPCPDIQSLEQFLLGQDAEEQAGRVEHHLADCQDCLELLGSLRPEDELLKALRSRPSRAEEEKDDRLVRRLERQAQQAATLSFVGTATDTPPPGLTSAGGVTREA